MADAVVCTSCGTANPPDAKFCVSCGRPVQRPAEQPVRTEQDSFGEQSPTQGWRPTAGTVAAAAMLVVCALSLWVLLRPQPELAASDFFKPSTFTCDYSAQDGYDNPSGTAQLEITSLGWNASAYGDGFDGVYAGAATYDATSDTLSVQGEGFGEVEIRGFSGLRFPTSGATVKLTVVRDDGYESADTAALELTVEPDGLRGNARSQSYEVLAASCATVAEQAPGTP